MNSENHDFDVKKCDECIKKSFSTYTAEKAGKLLRERYNPIFVPLGMIMYIQLVEHDVKKGIDGYTGKQIQASPIGIFDHEIVEFSKCMKSNEYANEVKTFLDKLNN